MTENNSGLPAAEQQKIVVLDDDRLSSHNLNIQLRFVGETPLLSTSDNWQQLFGVLRESQDLDNVFAIAVGIIKSYPLIDLLNTLHSHFPHLPLLLLNNQEEIQYWLLPESLQAKFLPLGDSSLNYRSLLVALQKARQLSGHAPNLPPSSIISETGTAMFRSLSGQSERMQKVRQLLQGVAMRPVTALVIGESGTGKEIVARNLHYHSGRAEKPFIVVDCAAVAPDRQGVELFGQEKNLHGTLESFAGLIERADGGTLFFDDVAELPLNVQGMLLRFLEDRKFRRVGGHTTITIDVRIVAATRYSLEEKIRQGNFRQDLYYRLSVVPIEIPPLRNHVEDIPELIKELLFRLENKEHSSIRFNSAAMQSLQQHSWPGNVRELANLVERMCIINPNEVIGIGDLPQEYQYASNGRRVQFEEQAFQSGRVFEQMAPGPDTVTYVPAQTLAPVQTPVPLVPETAAQVPQQSAFGTAATPVPAAQTTPSAPVAKVFTPAQSAATNQQSEPRAQPIPVAASAADRIAAESQQQPAGIIPVEHNNAATEHAKTTSEHVKPSAASVMPGLSEMMPLNAERLEQYLQNLERNLLEVAMLDSANIMKFAAERLKLDEGALREKLQRHGLTA